MNKKFQVRDLLQAEFSKLNTDSSHQHHLVRPLNGFFEIRYGDKRDPFYIKPFIAQENVQFMKPFRAVFFMNISKAESIPADIDELSDLTAPVSQDYKSALLHSEPSKSPLVIGFTGVHDFAFKTPHSLLSDEAILCLRAP